MMVQIGYSYDCFLESTFTGYLLQCKGWTSAYLYPKRPCFMGCSPVDMKDAMVQMLKWSSELFRVSLSKFSPLTYGISRMSILQSMTYGYFTFSTLLSVAFVLYGVVPQWGFLKGIPLFPKVKKSVNSGSKLNLESSCAVLTLDCSEFAAFRSMVCCVCCRIHFFSLPTPD